VRCGSRRPALILLAPTRTWLPCATCSKVWHGRAPMHKKGHRCQTSYLLPAAPARTPRKPPDVRQRGHRMVRRPREWPQPLRRVAQLRPWSGFRRPVGRTFPGGGGGAAFFPRARRAARFGSSCSSGSGVDRAGSSAPFGSVFGAMSGTSSPTRRIRGCAALVDRLGRAVHGPRLLRSRRWSATVGPSGAGADSPAPMGNTWAGRTSSSEDHASRLAARPPGRRAPFPPPQPGRGDDQGVRPPGRRPRRPGRPPHPTAARPADSLITSYRSGDHQAMITMRNRRTPTPRRSCRWAG